MNPRTRRVRNQKEPAGAPSPAAVLGEAERQGPPTPCPRRDAPRVNVIGIGVQKAATTWLWKCLGEHPEIRMPRQRRGDRKELNFFNRHWERGFGWYEELFRPGPWRNIEFSTLYFHDAGVPERVYRYNPEVKLVVALRNPIDRAYSHHRHEYSKGRVPGERRDFWAAAALNPSYLEIGLYARHLERWLDWFSLEKIHVVFHDDICADPGKVLRRAFHFLEMDPGFQPASTHRTVNEAIRARIPGLNRWLRKASRGIRKGFGARVHGAVKATGVGRTLRRRNRVKVDVTDVPSLGPADRKRLAAVFRAENERLGKMLGRDLSHWI